MGPHVWANEGVAHRFCCCVMCCDRCISVLLPEDARRSRGSDDRGGEATGSWCNDALRDPGNDQIPEVPELRPHDLPGYFRVHPMDCNWEPELVCKTLWVRAVVRDPPGLAPQQRVGFRRDSSVVQFACKLGSAWLQLPSSRADCDGKGPEQCDVLGDGI